MVSRAATPNANTFFIVMQEIWKDIIGYEGLYQISNLGNVKSLERYYFIGRWKDKTSKVVVKEKLLVISTYAMGYTYVVLANKCVTKKFKIHRLLGIHFMPNPNNYEQINHINAIRNDNRLENLEWCTHSHNMKHKFKLGNQSNAGGNNAMAKKVINVKTGVVYGSVKEAAASLPMSLAVLYYKLKSDKNNTPFIYR